MADGGMGLWGWDADVMRNGLKNVLGGGGWCFYMKLKLKLRPCGCGCGCVCVWYVYDGTMSLGLINGGVHT